MQLLIFTSAIVVLALASGYILLYTIRNRHRKRILWLVVLAIALAPPASLIWVPFVMRLFFSTS